MATLTTGKIAEVMFEKALETYETQDQLLPLCTFEEPDPGSMQNANNIIWKPVQQHAPDIQGWDLTGQETGIIEETYPCFLEDPHNDFVKQRADDMRSTVFWERRGEQAGRRQASVLNQGIANAVNVQGSKFYRSTVASGYEFVAEGQAMLNENQSFDSGRCYVLNDRATLKFSSDLAGRQTLQGRPESDAWQKGQIGANVAGFDVYTGSYLPASKGGADPAATVTGDQSFAPEAGAVDPITGAVTNVDYRTATIPVSDSSSYDIGDKVTIGAVQSIGLDDKTETGQLMTFTVTGTPDGTSLTIYPKPIALDDVALSTLEQAYANVNTTISNLDAVNRLNTDANAKVNLFWDKSAVEVTGGTIPAELFSQYEGMRVMSQPLSNGLQMYMIYSGEIADVSFRYRLFTWWGVTVGNPQAAGSSIAASA